MSTNPRKHIFDPLVAKHFTPEQLDALSKRPYPHAEAEHEWESLDSNEG